MRYSCEMRREFIEWLEVELQRRGWSYNELGRRAKMTGANVSRVMGERQSITYPFVAAVAHALKERPERLFRLAGLLPQTRGGDDEITLRDLIEIARELSVEERRLVTKYAQWRLHEERTGRAPGTDAQPEAPAA